MRSNGHVAGCVLVAALSLGVSAGANKAGDACVTGGNLVCDGRGRVRGWQPCWRLVFSGHLPEWVLHGRLAVCARPECPRLRLGWSSVCQLRGRPDLQQLLSMRGERWVLGSGARAGGVTCSVCSDSCLNGVCQ